MIYFKVFVVVCILFFYENIFIICFFFEIGLYMFVISWFFNDKCRVNVKKKKVKIKGFIEEWYCVIYNFFYFSGVYFCFCIIFKI